MRYILTPLFCTVFLVGIAGCSSATGDGETSQLIRAADGGVVRSADGLLEIEIPAGALDRDTEITVNLVPTGEWNPVLAEYEVASNVYEVLPEGLAFAIPATMRLGLDAPTDDAALPLMWGGSRSADGTVEQLEGSNITYRFPAKTAELTAEVSHFSWKFAVIAEEIQLAKTDFDEWIHPLNKSFSHRATVTNTAEIDIGPTESTTLRIDVVGGGQALVQTTEPYELKLKAKATMDLAPRPTWKCSDKEGSGTASLIARYNRGGYGKYTGTVIHDMDCIDYEDTDDTTSESESQTESDSDTDTDTDTEGSATDTDTDTVTDSDGTGGPGDTDTDTDGTDTDSTDGTDGASCSPDLDCESCCELNSNNDAEYGVCVAQC